GPGGNRFADLGLAWLPVPLPEDYLLGLDFQKKQLENRSGFQRSYLRGVWQNHGWWYYYLYALAIKVPLGTWLLAACAVCSRFFFESTRRATWADDLVLLLPLAVILGIVSAQTGFNHHMRYVLPILPFGFVWMSRVGRWFQQESWKRATVVAGALAWSVASSLSVYPHSLSYFNALAGGPSGGHAHLIDSNIDWGQDLLYLRDWMRQHPEASPLSIAFFGNLSPSVAGLDVTLPPGGGPARAGETDFDVRVEAESGPCDYGPHPGWYAVSVNYLRGVSRSTGRDLRYFQKFTPVARAGYSILIYQISEKDADRVRRESGLPPLGDCDFPPDDQLPDSNLPQ
ncbi:MAG: hypothetical protein KF861_22500, partial [Planctomycetaceae bacterium]|nr:hypothetical protein [Planctomycetaceae bacterium]